MLSSRFEFSGHSDYWGGAPDRGRGGGCAFAYYGPETSLRDIVDQWVEDAWSNEYDFEDCPESVTSDDIRECILGIFNEKGLADYNSNALCEWAAYCEDERVCDECGEAIGEAHADGCTLSVDLEGNEGCTSAVMAEDCQDFDDCHESPIVIVWIDWSEHPDYKPNED